MRSKTCIPQQQMDYHRPWRYIYNQVKHFNIFEQIDFPKAPPAEGACTGHACPLSAIWADQHIGKWWFKGKIIAKFKIKKGFHQTICVFFFVVFLVPLCSSCCPFATGKGWKISEPRWFNFRTWLKSLFSHQDTPKTNVTDFKKHICIPRFLFFYPLGCISNPNWHVKKQNILHPNWKTSCTQMIKIKFSPGPNTKSLRVNSKKTTCTNPKNKKTHGNFPMFWDP